MVLPDGSWQDVFTGEVFQGGATPATDLLDIFPVSVLKKIEES